MCNASWLGDGGKPRTRREPVVVHGNTSIIHATSEGLDEVGHVLRYGGDMESTLGVGEAPKRNFGGASTCCIGDASIGSYSKRSLVGIDREKEREGERFSAV